MNASGSKSYTLTGAWPFARPWLVGAALVAACSFEFAISTTGAVAIPSGSGLVPRPVPVRNAAKSSQVGADAVVLVNSASANYLDFQHYIQPYADNFGVPYTVLDVATNHLSTTIETYALIIIGHKQLDTNHVYLDSAAQAAIAVAVSNGVGLVNFDSDLSVGGAAARYQFIQDIFGFGYGTNTVGASVQFPPTEPKAEMHFITKRHLPNESLVLSNAMTIAQLTLPTNVTAVAQSAGRPFLAIRKYGQGRAVQWAGYEWVSTAIQGPVNGLDDLVWRGFVWAARKPFVLRGLPNFVAMRVDDVAGPFWWTHIANEVGFKPFLALFLSDISPTNIADLRALTTSGNATASIHSFNSGNFFYFNHQLETSLSDNAISNNFYLGTQWHQANGIPISKCMIPHYSEIGPNAFAGLRQWGVEFIAIEVAPGTIEYAPPYAPWLIGGPYRRYESPGQGQSNLPLYYADFLSIPGHPEFEGQFFNRYTEVRNTSAPGQIDCGEWCPNNNDVAGSINRATRQIKRALDSRVLASVFTHEWFIQSVPSVPMDNPISTNNWRAIMQGITNNLGAYQPIYVTTDFADQYVRATRTSQITSARLDPVSGQVNVTFAGKADLATSIEVFVGEDNLISNLVTAVPAFPNSVTITAATLPVQPSLIDPSYSAGRFQFTLLGQANLNYVILASTNLQTWIPVATNNSIFPSRVISIGAQQKQTYYRALLGSFAPAQPFLSDPSYAGGQFTFTLMGQASVNYTIWASADLAIWTPVATNNFPSGTRTITLAAPAIRSFYRASIGP